MADRALEMAQAEQERQRRAHLRARVADLERDAAADVVKARAARQQRERQRLATDAKARQARLGSVVSTGGQRSAPARQTVTLRGVGRDGTPREVTIQHVDGSRDSQAFVEGQRRKLAAFGAVRVERRDEHVLADHDRIERR